MEPLRPSACVKLSHTVFAKLLGEARFCGTNSKGKRCQNCPSVYGMHMSATTRPACYALLEAKSWAEPGQLACTLPQLLPACQAS